MTSENIWHVYPDNDLREHQMDSECWCRPEVDYEGAATIVVHNSLDGREAYETGERKPH